MTTNREYTYNINFCFVFDLKIVGEKKIGNKGNNVYIIIARSK